MKKRTLVAGSILTGMAFAILSGVSANAATGTVCDLSSSIVGDVISTEGTVTFPAEADYIVIGIDLAAAGGQNATIDPVFTGAGSSYTFDADADFPGVNLPALPATVTVNWKYYTGYDTDAQQSFTGSCDAVNVADANPAPGPTDPPAGGGGDVPPVYTPYDIDRTQQTPWPLIGTAGVMLLAIFAAAFGQPLYRRIRGAKSSN